MVRETIWKNKKEFDWSVWFIFKTYGSVVILYQHKIQHHISVFVCSAQNIKIHNHVKMVKQMWMWCLPKWYFALFSTFFAPLPEWYQRCSTNSQCLKLELFKKVTNKSQNMCTEKYILQHMVFWKTAARCIFPYLFPLHWPYAYQTYPTFDSWKPWKLIGQPLT